MIQHSIQVIAAGCGIDISRYERIEGGDINECYCLYTTEMRYFLKLNSTARFPDMFTMEAAGLNVLRSNSSLVIPQVIKHGITGNQQWLLLQWLEKASPEKNSLENFGAALAGMHRRPELFFGWHTDNYIGSLPQLNTPCNNWPEFYIQNRVLPLVRILHNKGAFSKHDLTQADAFCKKAENLFPPEQPALLHGDLWSGNYMITAGGKPAVFDPAVYYGHREMDLGMTKLFGGFPEVFYEAYHATYPLEKNWQQRLPLTQLYPILVHAVLFGGHYIKSASNTIAAFNR